MTDETSQTPAPAGTTDPNAAPGGVSPPAAPSGAVDPGTSTPAVAFTFQDAALEQVFGKVGSDGRPENVAPKYWDADKKAIKADVMHGQLKWLESKLGSKIEALGAPAEDYKIAPTEKVTAEILQEFGEDARLKAVMGVAKELDLSESAVSKIVTTFLEQDAAAVESQLQAELGKLGTNASQRVKDVGDWIDAAIPPENRDALKALCTTAAAVEAVEALMRASQPPRFNANPTPAPTGPTREEWEAAYFKTNERGERLVAVDAAYAKRVAEMRDKVFGTTRRDPSGRAA